MPLTSYSLDKFVAQELSKLTAPAVTPVGEKFSSSDGWLSSFVLNSIFVRPLSQEGARIAFAWVRRASAAIEDYDAACDFLLLVARKTRVIAEYFRALGKIESAVAMLYQANDFVRVAVGNNLFEKNDGSPLDRLNQIYNISRHAKLRELPEGHLHPIWLRNDGIYAHQVFLEYSDFETSYSRWHRTQRQLQNAVFVTSWA